MSDENAQEAEAAEGGAREHEDATRVSEESTSDSLGVPSAPATVHPGEVLADRYRIIDRIGKGGMGEVHVAEHVAIGRLVAIKTLSGAFHERPELARRFLQEARTASQIRHPNIVDITDFGHTERGAPFFVMELLEGEDLKALVKRERTLPWERVTAITTQICAALDAAHARGVIHRDLKPDNVFLVRYGDAEHVKVLDFGIAKVLSDQPVGEATRTGVLLGTPHYMSPEQAADDPLDARSDVYALGVLLYRMTTGRLPFRGNSFMKVLGQQIHEAPPAPREVAPPGTITAAQEAIILRCLAKRPDDRYPSAGALAAAIRACEADGPLLLAPDLAPALAPAPDLDPAPAPTPSPTPAPPSRARHLAIAALLAAALVALVVLLPPRVDAPAPDPAPIAAPPVAAPTPPPSAAPPPPTTAEPSAAAEHATTGAPVDDDADPTTTAAALPESPADRDPADKPVRAKKPVARQGEPRDALTSADLAAAARAAASALAGCSGGIPGMTVKVDLDVGVDGKVTRAEAQKPQRGSALGKCVEDAARAVRFPRLKSLQTINVPFRLP